MLPRPLLLALPPAAIALAVFLAGGRVDGELRPAQLEPRIPRPGDFLIASQRLDDANFSETVILLLHAGAPDGAQGIVVNRRTPVRVATALPGIAALADRPDTLYWGGPVEPRAAVLLARLDRPPASGVEIVEGVWLVRTREGIDATLRREPPAGALRFFSGYAGWTSGQLEWELSTGNWYLRRADADDLFTADVDALWKRLSLIASAPIA